MAQGQPSTPSKLPAEVPLVNLKRRQSLGVRKARPTPQYTGPQTQPSEPRNSFHPFPRFQSQTSPHMSSSQPVSSSRDIETEPDKSYASQPSSPTKFASQPSTKPTSINGNSKQGPPSSSESKTKNTAPDSEPKSSQAGKPARKSAPIVGPIIDLSNTDDEDEDDHNDETVVSSKPRNMSPRIVVKEEPNTSRASSPGSEDEVLAGTRPDPPSNPGAAQQKPEGTRQDAQEQANNDSSDDDSSDSDSEDGDSPHSRESATGGEVDEDEVDDLYLTPEEETKRAATLARIAAAKTSLSDSSRPATPQTTQGPQPQSISPKSRGVEKETPGRSAHTKSPLQEQQQGRTSSSPSPSPGHSMTAPHLPLDDSESDDEIVSPDVLMTQLTQASQREMHLKAQEAVEELDVETQAIGDEDAWDMATKFQSPEPSVDDDAPTDAASVEVETSRDLSSSSGDPPDTTSTTPVDNPPHKLKRQLDDGPAPPAKRSRTSPPTSDTKVQPSLSPKPRRKQRRTESSQGKVTAFERDLDFWFLDDLVVIQIGNAGFRLSKEILSKHSKYFGKLFNRSPSGDVNSTPLYRIHDPESQLSTTDFKRLLQEKIFCYAGRNADLPFDALAQVARAAEFLEMDAILKEVSDDLERFYPRGTMGAMGHPFAAEAVALADISESVDFLLKPAMYDLLCRPPPPFTSHRQKDQNPAAIFLSLDRTHQLPRTRLWLQQKWEEIRSSKACFDSGATHSIKGCECDTLWPDEAITPELDETEANARLKARRQRMLVSWVTTLDADVDQPDPQEGPIDVEPGQDSVIEAVRTRHAQNSKLSWIGQLDIMLGIDLLMRQDWKDNGLECDACVKYRCNNWRKKRKDIWKKLDEWFAQLIE
ncbi:hypothetical protein DL93DRAFT_2082008 [Clavulina sp. PMI_390]|nr:hypothetical protein DL93DRAFT_2082008 [Clavulina sp. PMI_390]